MNKYKSNNIYDSSHNKSVETSGMKDDNDYQNNNKDNSTNVLKYSRTMINQLSKNANKGDSNSQYEYGEFLLCNENKRFLDGLRYIFKSDETGNSKAEEFLILNIDNIYKTLKDKSYKIDSFIKLSLGKSLLINNNYLSGEEILKESKKEGDYLAECYLVLYEFQISPRFLIKTVNNLFINDQEDKSVFVRECLYNSFLKEKDVEKIISVLEKSFENSIKYLLGLFYLCTKDLSFDKGIDYIDEAANNGYAPAEYLIGLLLLNGMYGYTINKKKSFNYMKRSAMQGYGLGEFQLAKYYNIGIGTSINLKEAFNWMRKAALDSHIDKAYLQLGLYYKCGVGTPVNMRYAKKYILKLTEGNRKDAEAFYIIGVMNFEGDGFEKDKKKAFKCFQKASDMGHTPSKYLLAECYFHGEGCEENMREAFYYYKEASKKNHIKALYKIAICYIEGYGCERDVNKGVSILNSILNKLSNEEVSNLISTYKTILESANQQ